MARRPGKIQRERRGPSQDLSEPLAGRRVAIMVEEGYEDLEFWYPYYRLREAGADVVVAAHEQKEYKSKHGYPAEPTLIAHQLDPDEFDAVVIPGGSKCPDRMRTHREILDFVRALYGQGKLVAAICHAAWVPISAGIVRGHTMTCWPSVRDDLVNAGAEYVDREVVVDRNMVSSRRPEDLPAFAKSIIEALGTRRVEAVIAGPPTRGRGASINRPR